MITLHIWKKKTDIKGNPVCDMLGTYTLPHFVSAEK